MKHSQIRTLIGVLALSVALAGCSSLPSWMGGKKTAPEKLPGERISALPVGSELLADDATQKVAFKLPPAHVSADWPQHNGEAIASAGNLAASEFNSVVEVSAGGGEAFSSLVAFKPVVGQLATTPPEALAFAMDAVGHISAHDAIDVRRERWHIPGVVDEHDTQILGGGLAFDHDHLYATSGRGIIASYDAATGKELWRKVMNVPFVSAPYVVGDRLFVTTLDNQIYAIGAASGEVVWTQRGISEAAGMMVSISPAASGNALIVPYSSGEIYALAMSDGRVLWNDGLSTGSAASSTFSGIGGDPAVDDKAVFAVTTGGQLAAYYIPNGQRIWEKPVGSINTPWVAGDYLYTLSADNVVVCMVKYTGLIRWSAPLPSFIDEANKKDPIVWKGPVVVDGKVAIVSSNSQLKLLSAADGKPVLDIAVPEGIATAPVVAGRRMYLVGQNAKLYELQ